MWFDTAQALGYAGIVFTLANVISLSRRQRATARYWARAWVANLSWLVAGVLMGSAAVVVEALVFLPIVAIGTARFVRGDTEPVVLNAVRPVSIQEAAAVLRDAMDDDAIRLWQKDSSCPHEDPKLECLRCWAGRIARMEHVR